jgi:hypothetical protein
MWEALLFSYITQSLTVDFPLRGNVGSLLGVEDDNPVSLGQQLAALVPN